jgi:PPP family 3-phenylpropionic acid transporter
MAANQSISKPFLTPTRSGALFYLVALFGGGAFQPFLFVYFNELGLSGAQIGWLSILSPVMMLLFSTAVASMADRTHRRIRTMQVGLVCTALCTYLLRLPESFLGIVLLMLAYSIVSSPLMALGDGLVARMAQRRQLNYGGMRLWGSLGYAVSAVAFGAVWQKFGFNPMFLTAALFYLPLIWITGRLEEGPVIDLEKRLPFSVIYQNRGTLLLLLASFLAGISTSLFMTFGGIYVNSLGGGEVLIGLMVAVGGIAELPTMFYSSRIANRLGKTNTVILSLGLMALAYLGYILTTNANLIPLFSILRGLGYGLLFTVTIRLLVERTPEAWAATAQSLLTICEFGLSPLIAGPLGGWIHDAISPAAVFGLAIVTLGMAAVVLWFAHRRGILD